MSCWCFHVIGLFHWVAGCLHAFTAGSWCWYSHQLLFLSVRYLQIHPRILSVWLSFLLSDYTVRHLHIHTGFLSSLLACFFLSTLSKFSSPGHHSLWQPPALPLPVWVDGAAQGVPAKADPGSNHQGAVRTLPAHPGHAGAHQRSWGVFEDLWRGIQGMGMQLWKSWSQQIKG